MQSGGELERVLRAGGQADKIVFSGVGKTVLEMRRALEVGIRCFNVESEAELQRLNQVAGDMNLCAPVSKKINLVLMSTLPPTFIGKQPLYLIYK